MANKEYLVSICIPTYNRCEYLREGLESLICQEEFKNGLVEIVVCDNASTDDTQIMMNEYLRMNKNIKYYRNQENVGSTMNPKIAMGLGKGSLLKLVGDDFLYDKDALALFCHYSRKYGEDKPQIFFSNGIPESNKFCGEKIVNFEYFVYSTTYWLTWAGTYAIWSTDLDKYYDDNEGIEKCCWQVPLYLDVMAEKDRGVMVGNHFADRQELANKNVSYDLFQVFYVNFLSMLQPYCQSGQLSKSCIEWVRRDLLLRFFPSWVAAQEAGIAGFSFAEHLLKEDVERECSKQPYYDIYLRVYKQLLGKMLS